MARYVKCVRCGTEIDKEYDFGWEQNKKTKRYVCSSCANRPRTTYVPKTSSPNRSKNTPGRSAKMPPEKIYKLTGMLLTILGIAILVMSLLLLLAVPSVGIYFAVCGIVFVVLGRIYAKKANQEIQKEEPAE